ncbi:restriction endonuclease subunit S [Bacteroides sp.]|uniref:restriction endonuclease subunit S n=1 Tax=Bacteroides sp. TaxID=29523 RepID=UPI0025C1307B|nr:restriction endonuclease subunit S [Bacteroides sp.]
MENRYDKYKDSGIAWIREIPEHWEVTSFKRKITINNGKDYKDFLDAEIYPVIGSGGCFTYCSNYMYDGEALLLGRKGTIDKPLYVKGKFWAVDTMFYAIPHTDLNCKFAYYLALMFPFNLYSTSTSLPSLTQTDLGNILVAFPFIDEQQSIATYLDQKCSEIDELITLQDEMITKLQSYKQSVITEAVTKGLDKNVPLKDSGIEWIGEIPEHWTSTVFKKFLSETMQYGANEPAEECNYNDPRYIRITDIKDDGTLRDDTFKSLPLEKAKEYMLNKGDLLFARSGATVGKTFLYKEDYAACFAGYLIKARCNKNELLPNFVFYYTLSNVYQNWKNSIFIQSTIQNIGADKYSVMPIIVPSLSEQQSIANYLVQKCSEIDELISIKQQKIEKLKDYKKSLIFECVTGKRKVS